MWATHMNKAISNPSARGGQAANLSVAKHLKQRLHGTFLTPNSAHGIVHFSAEAIQIQTVYL
jgi:hypothetical protein